MVMTRTPKRASSRAAGKRQADDAALRGRIGGLAHLPLIGRDGGGADHQPALAIGQRLQRRHPRGHDAHHVEGADQVHADHALEQRQVMRAIAAGDAGGGRDAGAGDRDAQRAKLARGFDRRDHHRLLRHIARDGDAADARRNGLRLGGVNVQHHDLGAGRGQRLGGGGTQAGAATGDDGGSTCNIHDQFPP
jgi:hypothetical protein